MSSFPVTSRTGRSINLLTSEAFKRDLGLFLDVFLLPEKAILEYAGLDGNAQQRILLAAASTQASIDVEINLDQIFSNIDRLRRNVCDTATRIEGVTQRREVIGAIRRIGLGLGGVALIVSDVPLVTPGPQAVVAALSAAAGATLLGLAVSDDPGR